MIRARIKSKARDYHADAHCGHCGQYLWTMKGAPVVRPARLEETARGWNYDATLGQWEMSKRHKRERHNARARVRDGRSLDFQFVGDRAALRLGRDLLSAPGWPDAPWNNTDAQERAFALPARIVCPRCSVVNLIEEPDEVC